MPIALGVFGAAEAQKALEPGRDSGFGFRVWGLGGLGSRVWGLGFGGWGGGGAHPEVEEERVYVLSPAQSLKVEQGLLLGSCLGVVGLRAYGRVEGSMTRMRISRSRVLKSPETLL